MDPSPYLGKKTVASVGSLTSLAMLAMITEVLRLIGVSPCLMPRIRRGTMMANAGASTDCKVDGVKDSQIGQTTLYQGKQHGLPEQ